ncbi:ribosomal RNA processing 1-like B [Solea senegalensis]|uniref:Ribosomal RNA processing 1-like B n=1 Tax=Solea senegalensis TaxID=28829 RepID=A0AAV6RC09_SOLSE|nr:ribosomal RNA processing protein 1 homolog B [Solea senegalensis]KAG7502228.1 ribosomal RNA processing 1-like B [Solea senegalensis]
MSLILEPEVQFAQKLAANEKPTRTKALKKLRKYINVRSQNETGGFTSDELLKLWKGLFYCLWMQDKPLMQEDLSNHISSLIHSFHDLDGQILYLEGFLQTMKREWTGIDRLRMDKFFQLVRFVFRQTFVMLKRKNWESSGVARFLQLLTAELLQHDSAAPCGLQLHILDLYLTELATVGSEELTADQNLLFIEPFCKTAAKTKDRTLFGAICSNIFSTIIEQAPFAIEELMKEMKAAEDSDSGQASDDCEEEVQETTSKPLSKKITGKQLNGCKSNEDDEDDEDELLHMEDSDTELHYDDDIGPVLQFDYSGLADKLLKLASRNSTPSHNRQKLYKIIKVLRDLSEGILPRNEYPEEVSTDEDDDMFGSRRRMKKKRRHHMNEQEGTPSAKKWKKPEASNLTEQNEDVEEDDGEQIDQNANEGGKKKKRKKKKARVVQAQSPIQEIKKTEGSPQCSQTDDLGKGAVTQNSISSGKDTEAATSQAEPETLYSEANEQPSVTVNEELKPCTTDEDQSETLSKKKKRHTSEPQAVTREQQPSAATASEISTEADTPVTRKKKKKNDTTSVRHEGSAENDTITKKPTEATALANLKTGAQVKLDGKLTETNIVTETSPHETARPLKKKTKKKSKQKLDEIIVVSPVADGDAVTPVKNKGNKSTKKKKLTLEEQQEAEEATLEVNANGEITVTKPAKKKRTPVQAVEIRGETHVQMVDSVDTEIPQTESEVCSSRKPNKKKRRIPVVFEFEADEVVASAQKNAAVNGFAEETLTKKEKPGNDVEEPPTPLSTKKSQKKVKNDFITFQSNTLAPTPLFCRTKGSSSTPLSSKKTRQTPKSESKKVTFGLKNNKTAEFRKSDRSLLVSPDGSSRVPFDPEQKPKFGVLKSPPTPKSTKIKKTRKMSLKSAKVTPKRRPLAADFF